MKNVRAGFLLYIDKRDLVDELTMEERGRLLTACYSFVCDGSDADFSDNASLRIVWKAIRAGLIHDAEQYDRKVRIKETEGRIGGIIRAIRNGQQLSRDSLSFLAENGYATREFLRRQGINKAAVDRILRDAKAL